MCRLIDNRPFREIHDLPEGEPEVYLFPNFGKSKGFGEPDALAVIGDNTFWFEVETGVRVSGKSFQQAILQLFRFYLLANAVSQGSHACKDAGRPHLAFTGMTLGDKRIARRAKLRKAGHLVGRLDKVIKRSVVKGTDHYVLLLDRGPKEITNAFAVRQFRSTLGEYYQGVATWCREEGIPEPANEPSEDRFWRLHWRGGLSRHFKKAGYDNPLNDGDGVEYIPIVSSNRRRS